MAGGKIRELVSDVTSLEINSILVDGISGRKMPAPTRAFLEIISAWVYQFLELWGELNSESIPKKNNYAIVKAAEDWKKKKEVLFQEWDALVLKESLEASQGNVPLEKKGFDAFVEKTVENKKVVGDILESILKVKDMNAFYTSFNSDSVLDKNIERHRYYNMEMFRLLRVQTRLAYLKDRLANYSESNQPDKETKTPSGPFAPLCNIMRWLKEKLTVLKKQTRSCFGLSPTSERNVCVVNRDTQELRKLWELKDGYIYAQNTVQIDGDIMSRHNLRLYRDRRLKGKAVELLAFHRSNVDVGIKHWHFIIESLVSIAKAVGEKIGNPFK